MEYRAPFWHWSFPLFSLLVAPVFWIPLHAAGILASFHAHPDPAVGCVILILLLMPFIPGALWAFFVAGEAMHCDARELRLARRRNLGRWQRSCYSCARIRGLQQAMRRSGRYTYVSVLTFQYDGKTVDMLQSLNWTDTESVLKACKVMGLDAVLLKEDEASAMQRDIDRRGWFINPLHPDNDEADSTKPPL